MLDQGPVEVGGFLGVLEGVVQLPVAGLLVGEVVEGHGEARGVGGWVVLDQGPVEVGSFSRGIEGFFVSSGIG